MCSLSQEQKDYLDSTIRKIADFPKPGVIFRDITTLLGDAKAFNLLISHLYDRYKDKDIDYKPGCDNIFRTEMKPHNFEGGDINEEGAENSIINLKNIKLTIYTMFPEFKETYFKECILPYITQVIPSTAIFEYEIIVAGDTKILETTSFKLNVVSVDGIVGTGEDTSDDIIFNYNKGGRKSDGGREQLKAIR